MPSSASSGMKLVLYHTDRHSKEGDMAVCIVDVVGLALVAKMCPEQIRALNTVSNWQGFPE